jgi:hypothetical protein
MHTIEISRTGDASVADQIAEMGAWLYDSGIEPLELLAVRILNARVRFSASFAGADDAERFRCRFDEEPAHTPS